MVNVAVVQEVKVGAMQGGGEEGGPEEGGPEAGPPGEPQEPGMPPGGGWRSIRAVPALFGQQAARLQAARLGVRLVIRSSDGYILDQ